MPLPQEYLVELQTLVPRIEKDMAVVQEDCDLLDDPNVELTDEQLDAIEAREMEDRAADEEKEKQ